MKRFKDVVLTHASKGGIRGAISPCFHGKEKENRTWDFGKGFYMGTKASQGKSLIANCKGEKFIYTVHCQLSKFSLDRILPLNGIDWALYVMYHRGKFNDILMFDPDTGKQFVFPATKSKLYNRYKTLDKNKDFVIGPIADDVLYDTTNEFAANQITDFAFIACINAMDYGYQYVAKTEEAAKAIKIINKEKMTEKEVERFQKIAKENSEKGTALKNSILANPYYRKGHLFSELIEMYEKGIDIYSIHPSPKTILQVQELESVPDNEINMACLDETYRELLRKLILCKYEALREKFLAKCLYKMAGGKKNHLPKPSQDIIKDIVDAYKKLPDFDLRCKTFMKTKEGKEFLSSIRKYQ